MSTLFKNGSMSISDSPAQRSAKNGAQMLPTRSLRKQSHTVIKNIGIAITDKIAKMFNMGMVGTLTINLFSVYQFCKLKIQGVSTKEALVQTGKQALFSLSVLVVSIVAQGICGSYAGIIVSVSIGIIMISYSVIDTVNQRNLANNIRSYVIDKCYPLFVAIE